MFHNVNFFHGHHIECENEKEKAEILEQKVCSSEQTMTIE